MFETGDRIVHPRYGAGTLKTIREVSLDGETNRYYCIQLTGDRGTVMIRADQIEEVGLRTATANIALIQEEMAKEPAKLDDDYRKRQSSLKIKIDSNDPLQIIEVLRDLSWRETTNKLTEADSRLKHRAQQFLIQELALKPSLDVEAARMRLASIISEAMRNHQQHSINVD